MSDDQEDPDVNLTVEQWLHQEMKRMLQELYIVEISYDFTNHSGVFLVDRR